MKKLGFAAIMAGVAVTSAQAADIAVKAPYKKAVEAQVYDWTGFYAGVNIGGGIARDRNVFSAPTLAPGGINVVSNSSPAGAIGGAQIGYNWQFGNWVLGVEADIQAADMKDTSCMLGCVLPSTYAVSQSLDWFGTVRGRAGLATGPVFSYVTGGFAYGGVKTTSTTLIGPPPAVGSINETRTGWTVGSGVEASLGGNWTGKIEYLYVDLGTQNVPNVFSAFIPLSTTSEIHEHIFRVGANYRIGGTRAYSEPTANWSGLYAGLNGGGGIARSKSSYGSGTAFDHFALVPDGYLGGGQIGYNWQAANWVYGLEADIQGTSLKDDTNCLFLCNLNAAANVRQSLPWFGTVRGRIGYSVGSTLFYGTGGLAYGEVKNDVTTSAVGVTAAASFKTIKTGWTVGGGMESPLEFFGMFGKNWTVKTEYLYVDLGSSNDGYSVGALPFTLNTKVQEHIVRGGINYHFNTPVVAKY